MRRNISFFISGNAVDIDAQSFFLMTYTMDDLHNPAIVENTYSQEVTLKGTPRNNRIFGEFFRVDRRTGTAGELTGAAFDPLKKVPFTIYNELNEILESGYVKLSSVLCKGQDLQYSVTLYGGLGSFFYSLAYDDDGNKRTLADLSYLDGSATELDFVINADAVKAAWADNPSGIWTVLNFAPAVNGSPEGNFDAKKGLAIPSEFGLKDDIYDENDKKAYTLKSGYALFNLSDSFDEWAAKDLRSYLQRPVLSMRAFLEAVCKPQNNGGYEVDASALLDASKFPWLQNLWMTLPNIPSLGQAKVTAADLVLVLGSDWTQNKKIATYTIRGDVPSGTAMEVVLNTTLQIDTGKANGPKSYSRTIYDGNTVMGKKETSFIFQAVAYSSDGERVGGSAPIVAGTRYYDSRADYEAYPYTPVWSYEGMQPIYADIGNFRKLEDDTADSRYYLFRDLRFTLTARDIARIEVYCSAFVIDATLITDPNGRNVLTRADITETESSPLPMLWRSYSESVTAESVKLVKGAASDAIAVETAKTMRSGTRITKKTLLSTGSTPADYLLSLAKVFGLYFDYDRGTRKITILRRNDLYKDDTTDLTNRVDLSKGVTVAPVDAGAKWLEFSVDSVGGAFADEYKSTRGKEYGIQKVNTGYDFNRDTTKALDGVTFKSAVSVLNKSKFLNILKDGTTFIPSPFVVTGCSYTLWDTEGDTKETEIAVPVTATVGYYNGDESLKGYDKDASKRLQLCTKDNKAVDGANVLLFFTGFGSYDYFKLTDDLPAMDVLNDNTPCWILSPGGTGDKALKIPSFSRYIYGGQKSDVINLSLDFGVPEELDMPGISYDPNATIYSRQWQKYIQDRYNRDTKVLTCYVDFSGMKVGPELLRRFYWFRGSVWVLNKITDYSLTTFDPVQCEFIQVQSKEDYINGQLIN